jgi:hypothetical protein
MLTDFERKSERDTERICTEFVAVGAASKRRVSSAGSVQGRISCKPIFLFWKCCTPYCR